MQVSQQIVKTNAVADNGQRGRQREKYQPFTNGRMMASFSLRCLLYSLDAVDVKKCARQ